MRKPDKQNFESKIVNIFLSVNLTFVLCAQKNHLFETVSTQTSAYF